MTGLTARVKEEKSQSFLSPLFISPRNSGSEGLGRVGPANRKKDFGRMSLKIARKSRNDCGNVGKSGEIEIDDGIAAFQKTKLA